MPFEAKKVRNVNTEQEQRSAPIRLQAPLTRRQVLTGGAGLALIGILGGFDASPALARRLGASTTPKSGGLATIGLTGGSATDTLDAGKLNSLFGVMTVHALYEPLVRRDLQFGLEYLVAESLEPESDKLDVWIAKIRPGLEFSNGKSVTADDVIFTFQRILDPKDPLTGSSILTGELDYKNLTALDSMTVRMPLFAPNVDFPNTVAEQSMGIVPAGYDPTKPIGSGPFTVKSFTPGVQEVVLKNPNYWQNGLPLLDELTFVSFNDNTSLLNALLGGEIDVIFGLQPAQIPVVQGTPGFSVLNWEAGIWAPLVLNVTQAPFNDVRVRQAFRLLVDRPQMVTEVLSGTGTVGNDVYCPADPDYNTSLPQRHQDLEQARFLLKQAGYGEGLSITLAAGLGAGGPGGQSQAQVFAEQAQGARVNCTVNVIDGTQWNSRYLQWDFTQNYWPVIRTYLTMVSIVNTPGVNDDSHWHPPGFTNLISEARKTLDPAKRRELIWAAQSLQYDQSGYVIPYFSNEVDATSNKIAGWQPSKNGVGIPTQLKSIGLV
jgi:peptide/nickel transport system substrate-binding protein